MSPPQHVSFEVSSKCASHNHGNIRRSIPRDQNCLPVRRFSVPAVLTKVTRIGAAYTFSFLYHGDESRQAVLQQTFLTALEVDGVETAWDQLRKLLVLGLEVRVDITPTKHDSDEDTWLVFGLYINTLASSPRLMLDNISQDTSGISSVLSHDWLEESDGGRTVSDGSLENSKNRTKSCSEKEHHSHSLNQTFILDEAKQHRCVHQYEVGVVVVTVSNQFLHLLLQCEGTWVRVNVDPLDSFVLVDGVRIKEVFSIKMGAMGHMVTKECRKCKLYSPFEEEEDISPLLLWFGDSILPSVRDQSGMVVGREGDRLVVQVDDSKELILFHGEIMEKVTVHSKVLVWAWKKVLRGGTGSFLEGAALVLPEDRSEGKYEDANHDETYDLLELSTGGIFSPIRSKFVEDDLLQKSFDAEQEDTMDVSLSVSFGSISRQSGDGNENFSMEVNHDQSTKHMQEMCLHDITEKDKNEVVDEIYFQSLCWRSSSPKPDAIIDAQFNFILAANDILNNYNDLVDDYDLMIRDDVQEDTSTIIEYSSRSPNPSLTTEYARKVFELEKLPASPDMARSLDRKMSHPPLSPIPEENTGLEEYGGLGDYAGFSDSPVASTPVGKTPVDYSGSPVTPNIAMDSGFCDSFTSGLNSSRETKLVLETFLDYIQFPRGRRNGIIDNFLAQLQTEDL